MQYLITSPDRLSASLRLPASKSISNRALVLHALAGGSPRPENLSDCDDTRVMIHALDKRPPLIDIKAAGTAMRFLTAYLSVTPGRHAITGTERMKQRPIRLLVDALRTLGASIAYLEAEGFPPLRIDGGQLQGGGVELEGSVSSQYISALLMIGPVLPQGLRLRLTGNIVSRPYIELTLQLMRDFGARADWTSEREIAVQPGGYHRSEPFRVESDWSAASYWYEMALLAAGRTGTIELQGLLPHSCQGDSRGAGLFARLGVRTDYAQDGVRLSYHAADALPAGQRLEADLVDMPDLAQTFVVACCLSGRPFRFGGLQSLKIKETDRLTALTTELRKLGYVLRCEDDRVLSWDGTRCPGQPRPVVHTYEDHRMAMAFAPACLVLPGIRVAEPQVVSKSYPHFWQDLREAGFSVTEE